MKVHRDIENLPVFKNSVVTIGTFDGVHLGHQQILTQLKEEASRINGETVIITFHPHPRKVISSSKPPIQLINTIDEKIELLETNDIDHLVVVPFTEAFSNLTAEQYVENFLAGKFHPHTVIIGYDHHFGQGRKGNYKLLEHYQAKGLFNLKEISEHLISHSAVSSTRIREALLHGEIETANTLLGYDFFFEGKVIEGNKLGRTLGYPTANLEIEHEEKLIPANGVYVVEAALVNGQSVILNKNAQRNMPSAVYHSRLQGMMNIGIRPTLTDGKFMIEVNLFDFDEDIYGRTLRVYVKKYLRPELKFDGLEELKEQLAKDKIETEKFFNRSI